MADDKNNVGSGDRGRVAANEGYEVNYFANKHGISEEQARALIARVGNDRAKLDAAVAKPPAKRGRPRRSAAATPARTPKAPVAASGAKPKAPSRARSKATPAAAPASKPRSPLVGAVSAAKNQVSAVTGRSVRAAQRTSSGARKFVSDLPREAMKPVRGVARRAEAVPGVAALAVLGAAAAGFLGGLVLGRRGQGGVVAPAASEGAKAHRADGADDSASFGAMIADEGTIPDTAPTETPTSISTTPRTQLS